MFREDDLLPVSALQHLVFCERQCALIYVEGVWADNLLTVEGTHLHERVDSDERKERRGEVRVTRGLALRSFRLGLTGRADVVEFHVVAASGGGRGAKGLVCGSQGVDSDAAWRPFPIEYKRGRPKRHSADEVQLCAQGLCLEEMLHCDVPSGALFYGQTRRRHVVAFDDRLRRETEGAAKRLHELVASRATPPARREPKCDSCSLIGLCLPGAVSAGKSAVEYLERAIEESVAEGSPGTV